MISLVLLRMETLAREYDYALDVRSVDGLQDFVCGSWMLFRLLTINGLRPLVACEAVPASIAALDEPDCRVSARLVDLRGMT